MTERERRLRYYEEELERAKIKQRQEAMDSAGATLGLAGASAASAVVGGNIKKYDDMNKIDERVKKNPKRATTTKSGKTVKSAKGLKKHPSVDIESGKVSNRGKVSSVKYEGKTHGHNPKTRKLAKEEVTIEKKSKGKKAKATTVTETRNKRYSTETNPKNTKLNSKSAKKVKTVKAAKPMRKAPTSAMDDFAKAGKAIKGNASLNAERVKTTFSKNKWDAETKATAKALKKEGREAAAKGVAKGTKKAAGKVVKKVGKGAAKVAASGLGKAAAGVIVPAAGITMAALEGAELAMAMKKKRDLKRRQRVEEEYLRRGMDLQ